MAMKFLNKKVWHTGSFRNMEKVWKAEQKEVSEQKKVEEIRLQIQQEKERSEFNAIMEKSGLVPRKPERLEFLYDSGYGVSFQNQDNRVNANAGVSSSKKKKQNQSIPGGLFDDKTHFANDSWRKSHSDPLLLIRQREQEAWKSVKGKSKDEDGEAKEDQRKHRRRV